MKRTLFYFGWVMVLGNLIARVQNQGLNLSNALVAGALILLVISAFLKD